MIERVRRYVAPAYLFLCLVLGGSAQGTWRNATLQLLAVGLIVWALIERRDQPLPRAARQLGIVIALAMVLVIIQLVPLPFGLWSALPGREFIAIGFDLLGLEPGAMPLSLGPYHTIATALALLPPLGMLAAMLLLRAYTPVALALALIGAAAAGVLLGILQVSSPAPEQSPWYLYPISNYGAATGFFANSNHMAALLLISIPFIAALGAKLRDRAKDVRMKTAGLALASSGLILVALGLLLNRSLAGLGLGLPVLLASLMILFGLPARLLKGGSIVIGLGAIAAIALLWSAPVGSGLDRLGTSTSVVSRQQIFANSVDLVREFGAAGTGLGTFQKVYPLREDAGEVDRFYVNHAHNDYAELAVETGLPGVLLILAFLVWWATTVWHMLRSPAADQFAFASAIASAAVLLHSAVDYPLRTGAISAAFAMCLVLIMQSRRSAHSDKDLRPARHLTVG